MTRDELKTEIARLVFETVGECHLRNQSLLITSLKCADEIVDCLNEQGAMIVTKPGKNLEGSCLVMLESLVEES